ncbi:M20 family metallopeptidase [uncultured Vibrio sp.]|uniref:M20 family metallopeptidase n=1 Tax=uncultured Vibrio sp. TaxID=114054 RepID=UPI002AA81921|nr:M20 family metallopeptidase [uncultured Vibrio sp.]
MFDFGDLKQLVEINSWTHNKPGVDQTGQLMQQWLGELGFRCERYKRENIGDHLLFSTKSNESSPKLLLLGHLDTVFSPETFEGFSQDQYWVYGPGVCDMKGGNFVALQALRNVFTQQGELCNVDFLLVGDEETGSDDSRELTKELATNYAVCIDFEAAGENHEVVIGRKGVATYHIDLSGKAAHAGNNYALGCDANLAAAKMMITLSELTDLAAGTTVNVGKMEGGIGANTISPQAHLTVEARFTSLEEQRRVLESIESIVQQPQVDGVKTELSGGLQRDVMVPTAAQAEFMAQIEAALGYSLLTEQRGGVSDANVVAGMGVATLDGFGPFGDGDHTHHERALKASFTRRIDEVTKILTLYSV